MQRVKARLNESPAQLALWRHVEAEPAAASAPQLEQSQLSNYNYKQNATVLLYDLDCLGSLGPELVQHASF
jgi:hypothetical protein